jgi:hypothetical protein
VRPRDLLWEIEQDHFFIKFYSSILYSKDNGVLRILKFSKGTPHTNSDSEWGNESFIQQISL